MYLRSHFTQSCIITDCHSSCSHIRQNILYSFIFFTSVSSNEKMNVNVLVENQACGDLKERFLAKGVYHLACIFL